MSALEINLIVLILTAIAFLIVGPIVYIKNKLKPKKEEHFSVFDNREKEPFSFCRFILWCGERFIEFIIYMIIWAMISGGIYGISSLF